MVKKKPFLARPHHVFFFLLAAISLTLQSCVSFIHLRVVFADKLCQSFEFAVSAFHMQVALGRYLRNFQYDARLPKQCLRINLLTLLIIGKKATVKRIQNSIGG